mmetsp:Transcript_40456/g.86167  ORF Transcript_40456/g.86167 Transcript_40456/m.86167 type:complete len:136 (+) Transcript_40456:183-590(+)
MHPACLQLPSRRIQSASDNFQTSISQLPTRLLTRGRQATQIKNIQIFNSNTNNQSNNYETCARRQGKSNITKQTSKVQFQSQCQHGQNKNNQEQPNVVSKEQAHTAHSNRLRNISLLSYQPFRAFLLDVPTVFPV